MLFFFKKKTAYEMRISDWSSDVCSSDLLQVMAGFTADLHGRMGGCAVVVEQQHQHAVMGAVGIPLHQRERDRGAGVASVAGFVPRAARLEQELPPWMAAGDRAAAGRDKHVAVLHEGEDRKSTRLNSSH